MPFADCGFETRGGVSGAERLVAVGPTISVRVGHDPAFPLPDGRSTASPPRLVPAMIDTGAWSTCIDSALAASLGLPVADTARVTGLHGADFLEVYTARVQVPDLGVMFRGRFPAAQLSAGGQYHRALIGRDFLRHYAMIYDGRTGAVRLVSDPP